MLNPTAVVMWLCFAGIGFLVGDGRGAVMGAVFGLALSLVAHLMDPER